MDTLHPSLDLGEANRLALDWCRTDNGLRVHGTTGEKSAEAFAEREQSILQALPATPFEMATWKPVTVHPDQYIQFEKKTYSLPTRFVSQRLWARGSEKLARLFDLDFRLVKQYVPTTCFRHTDPTDFPADVRQMLGERPVVLLVERAARIGPNMRIYLTRVLEPHAKINFRKAQGMLRLADHHEPELVEMAASYALAHRLFKYRDFRRL